MGGRASHTVPHTHIYTRCSNNYKKNTDDFIKDFYDDESIYLILERQLINIQSR